MVNATHLEQYGNNFKVYYEDGTTALALPTQGSIWLVSVNSGSGGGGGDGDYSWPYSLDYVTSEYGIRGSRFHEGMDWSGGPAVLGEPIPAIGDGTIEYSGGSGGTGFGNHVIIHHGTWDGFDWKSLYAHMQSLPPVSVGNPVSKGDTIGAVNNTGSSFGSHLHMEIHKCAIGGGIIWDNTNPSYSSSRTAINPIHFFNSYGDGGVLIP